MRELEQQQSSAGSGLSKPMANITIKRDPMLVARTADPFETSTYQHNQPETTTQDYTTRATPVAPVRTPSAAPRKPSCQGMPVVKYIRHILNKICSFSSLIRL